MSRNRRRDDAKRDRDHQRGSAAARPERAQAPPKRDERPTPAEAAAPPPRMELPAPKGARPPEAGPLILTVEPSEGYALLDSGGGETLERYGPLAIRRPENQAIWPCRLGDSAWEDVDAAFTGDTDEEGTGRWRFPKGAFGETWELDYRGLPYLGRFTSFRHVGVFPEQAAHWDFAADAIRGAGRPIRLLNLFGYTGLASLTAARAGAEVTHVDASKKAIGWARENADLAEMGGAPVRWICEDAVRYAEREVRRGNAYEGIVLDPPKFGRGPKGETWQLFEDLPYLLSLTRALLSDKPLFVILTAYSIRASFYSLSALMGEAMRGMGGRLESGELVIREDGAEPRLLSTSLFSRWTPTHG